MNATDFFKKRIGDFLQTLANTDDNFAQKFASKDKSIDECANYIMNSVRAMNVIGLDDEDVYALAVDYYNEDKPDPKKTKAVRCTVVSNHKPELSEDDKEALMKKARDDFYNECLAKQREASKPKKRVQKEVEQPSLFG